jgi:hypothetical protein
MNPQFLVAMRLADMRRVHPKMSRDHVCSACGERLGVYPSGQAMLRTHPEIKIVCQKCIPAVDLFCLVPGAEDERNESVWKTEE